MTRNGKISRDVTETLFHNLDEVLISSLELVGTLQQHFDAFCLQWFALCKKMDVYGTRVIGQSLKRGHLLMFRQRAAHDMPVPPALLSKLVMSVCETMLSWMKTAFSPYVRYCCRFDEAQDLRLQIQVKHPVAASVIDGCLSNELSGGMPLMSYLLTPVQRVCRYYLLLGGVLKEVERSKRSSGESVFDSSVIEMLQTTEKRSKDVATRVNDERRAKIELNKVPLIEERVTGSWSRC